MERPQIKELEQDIDVNNTTPVVCDKCKGMSFQPSIIFRKVSALLSPTGKEGFYPIQTYACVSCGHVNNNFLPKELRSGVSLVTP